VKQPCNLGEILSTVIKDVAGAALYKAITVDYVESGEVYPIWADEIRLYHLVLNLVDNAIKYSPRDTVVQVALDFTEYVISIQVRDQGPGIPEAEMPHLFEKYFRGTQAKLHPGAGVGLSVVRAIADAHGGQVAARSIPAGGTEFIVKLPGSLSLPD
jgi:signal transduction histidine kinase